jgi:Right handed beta helix region
MRRTIEPNAVRLKGFAWVICLALAPPLAPAARAAAAGLYVAPGGNDAAPGTIDRPLATLQAARDAARKLPPDQPRRIIVRGGEYFNVALTLDSRDSGLHIQAAPREKPILYGGERITGWQKDGDRLWAARLPPFPRARHGTTAPNANSQWSVRMLRVDGKWCPRARFPAEGTLTHLSSFNVPWMSSTGGGWKRPPTRRELTTLVYKPGDLGSWLNLTNAEITVYHMWDASCVRIAGLNPESHTLTLDPPTGHPPGAFGVKKYVLWNIRQGMTSPGQWYFDRSRHRLVYWPLPGQDMSRAEVIAPTRPTILRIRGTPGAPAKDITIRGLTFAVTTVPLKSAGFAAAGYDGAISLAHAESCTLAGLTVCQVAGHAIRGLRDVAGTRVENCEITDCGAGGIYVGGTGTVIDNNEVHAIGLAYPSAIGIYGGGRGNVVSHNEVHDCSYTAINYGGVTNIIEDNLIYHCMKVLHDGAAIYLFAAKGCVIRGNLARDITDTGGYGASAYYLDERSTGCVVERNLSLRVNWPSHNHMATNNIIRDNVFIVTDNARLTFPRSSGYTVEGNVLYATGKILIQNPAAVTTWSHNLFYSGVGQIEREALKKYARAGVIEGPPTNTVVADPRFMDWQNGDYRYQADSPVRRLGIAPIDVRHAGRVKR